jgi:ribosomal protein L16/L10AE
MLKKNKKFQDFFCLNYKHLTVFSLFKVRSLNTGFFEKKNFESSRRYISRKFRKKIKYLIYKKPYKLGVFKKSQKSRMGKGKGKFNF